MRNMQTIFLPNGNTSQKLAFTSGASSQADPISDHAHAVRLIATEDVYVAFEGDVEKTGTVSGDKTTGLSMILKANLPEKFVIQPGTTIQAQGANAGGDLYITELTSG